MLPEDVALQSSDISNLDSRDAVRDFLGRLGYDVSQARQTFPEAEGMPQRLQEIVKYLELSASDAPFLDVYLIELSSVTVAHIQALATHFKNRAGQVLAILTQDYKRLDFVLFDLRWADNQAKSTGTVRVLPRRFTFDRQHPSPERLRVIRRFLRRLTWTEPAGWPSGTSCGPPSASPSGPRNSSTTAGSSPTTTSSTGSPSIPRGTMRRSARRETSWARRSRRHALSSVPRTRPPSVAGCSCLS